MKSAARGPLITELGCDAGTSGAQGGGKVKSGVGRTGTSESSVVMLGHRVGWCRPGRAKT